MTDRGGLLPQDTDRQVGDGHGDGGDEVLRGDFELQSADARADVDVSQTNLYDS